MEKELTEAGEERLREMIEDIKACGGNEECINEFSIKCLLSDAFEGQYWKYTDERGKI